MNREQLREVLKAGGYRDNAYNLDGGLLDDRLTIDQVGGQWIVYYSERGKRWDERVFPDEQSACNHLLDLLKSDRSAR